MLFAFLTSFSSLFPRLLPPFFSFFPFYVFIIVVVFSIICRVGEACHEKVFMEPMKGAELWTSYRAEGKRKRPTHDVLSWYLAETEYVVAWSRYL